MQELTEGCCIDLLQWRIQEFALGGVPSPFLPFPSYLLFLFLPFTSSFPYLPLPLEVGLPLNQLGMWGVL